MRARKALVAGQLSFDDLMASIDWAELPTIAEAKAEERRQIGIHNPIGNVLPGG